MSEGLTMSQLQERNALLVTENESLKAQRDALAAESARMRIAIDRAIGWQESVDAENTESVRSLHELDTPATDAWLNSVRAEGVEMFADSAYCSRDQHHYVMRYADQLRPGKDGE